MKQKANSPRFSVDSTGRVYALLGDRWLRQRHLRADTLVNHQSHYLQRAAKIVRFQRWVMWLLCLAALVFYLLKR